MLLVLCQSELITSTGHAVLHHTGVLQAGQKKGGSSLLQLPFLSLDELHFPKMLVSFPVAELEPAHSTSLTSNMPDLRTLSVALACASL